MKLLVIGSGGREHAICHAFLRSPQLSNLYCAPGNGGIAGIAECVPLRPEDISGLAQFAETEKIDLTFVGGEGPLALGITDEFESRGLRIVGVSRSAARLEGSKSFAKEFMMRNGIPTAQFVRADSAAAAIDVLNSGHFGSASMPVVVKADGLAAGKGVVVAHDRAEALEAVIEMETLVGPDAAEKIVLEEFLEGREVSLIMFADGQHVSLMPPVRDHKRIGEGDTGPNTGGMGTFTDAGLLTPAQTQQIINEIIEPTLAGCSAEGYPFRGILFLGLMMTDGGPKLLEYNVRFGDPETQAILVRLDTDLIAICNAILDGTLANMPIGWRPGNSACVVLAAEGYPQDPRKGDAIHGLADVANIDGVTVFHAGTAIDEARGYVTSGGRVLGVTASGSTLDDALATAYLAAERISWTGMQYRRDIGK